MNWTIRKRLLGLGAAGVFVAVVLGLVAVAGFRTLGGAMRILPREHRPGSGPCGNARRP